MNKGSLLVFDNFKTDLKITSLWLKKGSIFDPVGKEGLAHLSEHLFMRRTSKFDRYEKLMEFLDSNYFIYNAYTDKELVYFYLLHPPGKENLAESLLEDCRNNIYFTDEDLEKEKKIIFNEQISAEKNRIVILNRLADKGIWAENAYSRNTLGTKETIGEISKKDIEDFRFKNLREPDSNFKIKKMITQGNISGLLNVSITFPFAKFSSLKEAATLDLVSDYLAGGWSSRLTKKLRIENEYAYWPTYLTKFFSKTGYFRIYYSVSQKNLQNTLKIVDREIEIIKEKNSFLDLELQKNIFKFKLKEKLSNIYTYVNWYGVRNRLFDIEAVDNYMGIIESLEPELLREIVGNNLRDSSVVLLGM